MYSNKLIILVILSYQCGLSVCLVKKTNVTGKCKVHVAPTDYTLPVPFTYEYRTPIFLPDMSGNLYFRSGRKIQLSCTAGEFLLPQMNNEPEITVTCIEDDKFMYNDRVFKYHDFLCKTIPVSRLVVTSHKCQHNASVAAIGFQTKKKFFILYNVCFDVINKNALYTWYFVRTPHKNNRHTYPLRPDFIKSKQFFEDMDVHTMYRKQAVMMLKTLRSKQMVKKYYQPNNSLFLSRGHLVSRTEFFYGFEQEATFYYENTTPTWQIFNKDLWRHIEAYLNLRLSTVNSDHLIVTGTYGLCTLPDKDNITRGLYIGYPRRIPVPQYVWKMDYDMSGKHKPVVFVGLNNPYQKIDESVYICRRMPCPMVVQNLGNKVKSGVVFCCSKKEFERVYGRLESIVFHRNMI